MRRKSYLDSLRSLPPLLTLLVLGACSSVPTPPPPPPPAAIASAAAPAIQVEVREDDPVLAAVGDIADCKYQGGAPAQLTAALLLRPEYSEVTVLALGDLVYRNGTQPEFDDCYDRFWGPLKSRTRPAPGNHDYGIYLNPRRNNADPYFAYFGTNAGTGKTGHYSFDVGSWHVVSLNSMAGQVGSAPTMAAQVDWLKADLAQAVQADQKCILAFWHHPFFTSGEHGDDGGDPGRLVGPLWDTLAAHHADVIVNGHDHDYERFGLQRRSGTNGIADPAGIREFVVGTGGARIRSFHTIKANSEARLAGTNDHGALFLTLHSNGYGWRFVKTDGTVLDQSLKPQPCHPKGDDGPG